MFMEELVIYNTWKINTDIQFYNGRRKITIIYYISYYNDDLTSMVINLAVELAVSGSILAIE